MPTLIQSLQIDESKSLLVVRSVEHGAPDIVYTPEMSVQVKGGNVEIYELMAVIMYSPNHVYARVRLPSASAEKPFRWFDVNDLSVYELSVDEVLSDFKHASAVFYHRKVVKAEAI